MTPNATSVASITVAYNGATVLAEHLDSLKRQTRKIDQIIVVDNASTDETRSWLAREYPDVKVIPLANNLGVGGALAEGLTYAALEKKYDWIWLFDQDSQAAPDALENLLAALDPLGANDKDVAVLAPVCTEPSSGTVYPGLLFQRGRFVPVNRKLNEPLAFVDMVITSGALMRREAIEQAGLPRSDFFIDFVDFEHCLRFRRHGFKIAVVRDSKMNHTLGTPTTKKVLGRVRNGSGHSPWREYYMTRNETFTMWRYYPSFKTKALTISRIAWHMMDVLMFSENKLACLAMMGRGFLDGRGGRLGIRFTPGSSASTSGEKPVETLGFRAS